MFNQSSTLLQLQPPHVQYAFYLHLISRCQFIDFSKFSYPVSVRRRINISPNYSCSLVEHVDSNNFGCDHDREYPGYGLDRIQDPRGVLGN
jgi:hypothetical protein